MYELCIFLYISPFYIPFDFCHGNSRIDMGLKDSNASAILLTFTDILMALLFHSLKHFSLSFFRIHDASSIVFDISSRK